MRNIYTKLFSLAFLVTLSIFTYKYLNNIYCLDNEVVGSEQYDLLVESLESKKDNSLITILLGTIISFILLILINRRMEQREKTPNNLLLRIIWFFLWVFPGILLKGFGRIIKKLFIRLAKKLVKKLANTDSKQFHSVIRHRNNLMSIKY